MGYPHNQKGYKLYSLEDKTMFVSRHVIFHEHVFPFKDSQFVSISSSNLTPHDSTDPFWHLAINP